MANVELDKNQCGSIDGLIYLLGHESTQMLRIIINGLRGTQ